MDDMDAWVWVLEQPHNHNELMVGWWEWLFTEPDNHNQLIAGWWEWLLSQPHNHNQLVTGWWGWLLTQPHNHNQASVSRGFTRDEVGRHARDRVPARGPASVSMPMPATDLRGSWPQAMRMNAQARRLHAAGRPLRALPLARAALRIVEHERGPQSAEAVNLYLGLSTLHEQLSEYDQAEAYARRANEGDASDVTGTAASPGTPQADRLRIRALARLAAIEHVRARIDHAERLYREALKLAEADAHYSDDLVTVLCGLGIVLKAAGRFDEAEELYRRAHTLARPDGLAAASLWHNLAGLDHARGRYAVGEPAARRSVALRTAAAGSHHPSVAADQAALASLLVGQGKYAEAEALYGRALSVFERAYGPDSYDIAVTCNDLGVLMAARGDVDSARSFYQRALRIKRTILGADHPEFALTRTNLAATRTQHRTRQRRESA